MSRAPTALLVPNDANVFASLIVLRNVAPPAAGSPRVSHETHDPNDQTQCDECGDDRHPHEEQEGGEGRDGDQQDDPSNQPRQGQARSSWSLGGWELHRLTQ